MTLTALIQAGFHRRLLPWLGVLLLAGSVFSQSNPRDLQFDMFPGYSGAMGQYGWAPVMFELKNDGAGFNGVIRLSSQSFGGNDARALVELPSGTLKRVTVPVFASQRYAVRWDAGLFDEKGRRRAEALNQQGTFQNTVSWRTRMMGALPRTTAGAPTLPAIASRNSEFQPVVGRMQPTLFPDNPIVLDRLSAIYLNSEKAVELKENQVRALLAWLHAGGNLIIGVEEVSDVNSLPWLRGIFPGRLNGTRTVQNHTALHEWIRSPMHSPDDVLYPSTGNSAPFANLAADSGFETAPLNVASVEPGNAEVLISAGDIPLVLRREIDRGRVTALLFSPEREPVKSWRHLPQFWARMLEVPGFLFLVNSIQNSYDLSSDAIFGAMVDSRQVKKLPVEWLLLLLVVYLVVIGPLDRWWLKKINKPVLTWITFPCYVVLFSGLIYLIGYKLRAGDSEWNELHMVDVFPAGTRVEMRGRTYASLYSPANATYPLASAASIAAVRPEAGRFGSDKGGLTVVQRGDTFRADFDVPVWVNQLCVCDYWQTSAPPVSISAKRESDGVAVTVNNQLDRPLTSVKAVQGGRIVEVGDVPARATKTVKVNLSARSLADWAWSVGGNFQMAVQQRGQVFGEQYGGRIDNGPNPAAAACFTRGFLSRSGGNNPFMTPPGLDLTELVDRGQAVLFAWTAGYAPVAPLNQFSPRRSTRNTLWRLSCEVED